AICTSPFHVPTSTLATSGAWARAGGAMVNGSTSRAMKSERTIDLCPPRPLTIASRPGQPNPDDGSAAALPSRMPFVYDGRLPGCGKSSRPLGRRPRPGRRQAMAERKRPRVRVGVVGAGFVARIHADAYRHVHGVDVHLQAVTASR